MTPAFMTAFWCLLVLQTKHFLCDFVLQSRYQWSNKGIYGHPGGILHAGLHSIGSIPALLLSGLALPSVAVIALAEFAVHYHTDWLKEQVNKRLKLSHKDNLFWAIFGADQFVHQLTYVAILAVALSIAGV